MPRRHPRHTIRIVQNLLKERARDPHHTLLRLLSARQVQGITLLAHFMDRARQARAALHAIDRLFETDLACAGHSHQA